MDERKQAILNYINGLDDEKGYTQEDIKVSDYDDKIFETPEGTFLCLTDEEADIRMQDEIENLIEDVGLDAFTPLARDYILEHFVDGENLKESMEECRRGYFQDIQGEASAEECFSDRCQEELFEFCSNNDNYKVSEEGLNYWNVFMEEYKELDDAPYENVVRLLTEKIQNCGNVDYEVNKGNVFFKDDGINFVEIIRWLNNPYRDKNLSGKMVESYFSEEYGEVEEEISAVTDWFASYEDRKDDIIEEAVEAYCNEYESPVQWVLIEFGKQELLTAIKEGSVSLRYDEITEYITKCDGRGSLAVWDGVEEEQGDFFIYQQDEYAYEREEMEEDISSPDLD